MKFIYDFRFSLVFSLVGFFLCFFPKESSAQGYIDLSIPVRGSAPIVSQLVGSDMYVLVSPTGGVSASTGAFQVHKYNASGTKIFSATFPVTNDAVNPIDMVVEGSRIFVLSHTLATDAFVTNTSTLAGGRDLLFTSFNSTTGAIVSSTYLGGTESDDARDLSVFVGEVYITGITSSADYPVTNGSTFLGGTDIFVTKLNTAGNVLNSTFLGGSSSEESPLITADATSLYISYTTRSNDVAVSIPSSLTSGSESVVAAKLSSTLSISYQRYVGAVREQTNRRRQSMEILGGEMYLAYLTDDRVHYVTDATTFSGAEDIILTKLGTSGTILFSTFLGGTAPELTVGIEIESSKIHLVSTTSSTDFPVTNGATIGASHNHIGLARYSLSGIREFSTMLYYGDGFMGETLDFDILGGFYYLSSATEDNFPVTDQSTLMGRVDWAIMKVNANGEICYSTYLAATESALDGRVIHITADGSKIHLVGQKGDEIDFPYTTLGSAGGGGLFDTARDLSFYTRYELSPVYSIPSDNISPPSQLACAYGLTQEMDGVAIIFPSSSMPVLYRAGVSYPQTEIEATYQWQVSDNPGGPWTDITPGILENYLATIGNIDQYFRRVSSSDECGTNLSISSVSAILMNGLTAPTVDAGGVFHTCPGSSVTIGGSPSASGGVAPYTYSWDNGLGSSSNPSASPSNNSIYTLYVTASNGCQQIDQAVVIPFRLINS